MKFADFIAETDDSTKLTAVDETINVKADVLPLLRNKIEKLNRKAAEVGAPPIDIEIVDTYTQNSGSGAFPTKEKWHHIKVTGKVPVLDGWKFLATIEHKEGGNVIRTVPGQENNPTIAKYYQAHPNHCDYCNKVRRRNDTYIVQSDSGTLKQVGSNCLKAFLGGHDVRSILWYFSSLGSISRIIDTVDHEFTRGRGTRLHYTDVNTVLTVAAAIIRVLGYVSSKTAQETGDQSTAQHVRWIIFQAGDQGSWTAQQHLISNTAKAPTTGDKSKAVEVLQWFNGLPEAEKTSSDFMRNLNSIVTSPEGVSARDIGYVVALYGAQERAQVKKASVNPHMPERKSNAWVGQVDQKIMPTEMFVVDVRRITTRLGVTILHTLRDLEGNEYKWFCSNSDAALKQGDEYVVTGTIKKHDEFKGQKSTMLTRVKAAQ